MISLKGAPDAEARVKSRFVLLCALVAILAALVRSAVATPTAPVTIVNHTTKQCAEVIQGDDCHWCDLLEGWEILGPSGQANCPPEYNNLGYQGMSGKCRAYKSQFCCTSPQHHGDCSDLVINEVLKQCAFVEEISGCILPEGWTSAGDTTQWQGRCPTDWWSGWLPEIACLTSGDVVTVTALAATATDSPTLTPSETVAAAETSTLTATRTPATPSSRPVTVVASPTPPDGSRAENFSWLALALGSAVALVLLCATALLLVSRLRR
jgi:hypothetical protein